MSTLTRIPLITQIPDAVVIGLTSKERVALSITDPCLFARTYLDSDLWDKQEEIMQAVAVEPRVAVKACHASSKTYSAARILLWFLARYDDSVVVTTAPTWSQVETILWGEIHSALSVSKYPFPEATQTKLRLGPKRYAYGLSTSVTKQDEGVKFQGIHAENVLVIIDEAPGVEPKIWEAIEGARAGGNVRVLALGNPTISSGSFHDAFTKNRGAGWKCFTISAFDTPNLKGLTLKQLLELPDEELKKDVRPYLTKREWVKEKYYEWGPGHPLWEARVLGNFPKQSEDALLSLTWLEEASTRELKGIGRLVAGLDVAGPGDSETSLTIRRGPEIVLHKQWTQADPRGEVVNALNPFKEDLEAVNVDSIGIGWNFYTHLVDLKFPTVPINIQEASSDTEKYHDQKAEFYWGLRMRLQKGDMSGLTDETTIGQLAGLRYKHNARGQIEIESKENAAKRGVKSPDRAESIMLAFASRQFVYGALEYYKQEKSAIEMGLKPASMQKTLVSQLIKPGMSDNQLSCPQCQAVCIAKAQGGWRCGTCGHQWWDQKPGMSQDKPEGGRTDLLIKASRSIRLPD